MSALPLVIAAMIGSVALGIYSSGYVSSEATPPEETEQSEPYCMSEDELNKLIDGETAFTCGYDGESDTHEWVLAAEDIEVRRVFIHEEKKLVKRATCDGETYYSWYCHPPDYGSLWKNTLWRLHDGDRNRELQGGERFDVFVRKDAERDGYWICDDTTRRPPGLFPIGDSDVPPTPAGEMSDDDIDRKDIVANSITVNGIIMTWSRSGTARAGDIEPEKPDGDRNLFGQATFKETDYDVYENFLLAFAPDSDDRYYLVTPGSFTEDGSLSEDTFSYHVFEITGTKDVVAGLRRSLKLGTFNPLVKKKIQSFPWYEVYLPESKPVVYLYPKNTLSVDIKILPIQGTVTVSDPLYDPQTGWQNVIAQPHGMLTYENKPYSSLYYETEVAGYSIPEEGFIVPLEQTGKFLTASVMAYGLQESETKEFIDYWIPRFEQEVTTPYLFITFIPQEEIDRVVPLSVSPVAETSIRIRPYFKPEPQQRAITPQTLPTTSPSRNGFTLVEWGGILDMQ